MSLFSQRRNKTPNSCSQPQPRSEANAAPPLVLGEIVEHELAPPGADFAASKVFPGGFPTVAKQADGGHEAAPHGAAHGDLRGVASAVDRENTAKINAMSAAEVSDAQAQIMATFSQETIDKFRALHARKMEKEKAAATTATEQKPKAVSFKENTEFNEDVDQGAAISAAMQSYHDGIQQQQQLRDLPPSSESSKLEWMTPVALPHDGLSQSSATDLRFSLIGHVIPFGVDLPVSLGLHHHGDDPASAGYTVKELIYLARSSVSSQRSLCTQTLVAIVQRFMASEYSPAEMNIIGESIRAYMVLIHIRAAIDDSSVTITSIGIAGVAAALGIKSLSTSLKTVQLSNLYRFTKNGHIAFEMSQRNLLEIVSKWSGVLKSSSTATPKKFVEGMSNEDVSSLVISDIIPSLAETHLFERFQLLLVTKRLNWTDAELVLLILVRMAQHSIKVANSIASTPGLLQSVRQNYLSIPWPNVNQSSLKMVVLSLQLMQTLLQANLRNPSIVQILESANIVIRFILLKPNGVTNDSGESGDKNVSLLYGMVQSESFRLLSLLFEYGSTTHLFFDLRNEFVNTGIDLLQRVKSGDDEEVWGQCLSFWKMVSSAAKLARKDVDGISSETISPLVLVGVEFFNVLIEKQEGLQVYGSILLSLLLDIFSEFLGLLVDNGPAFKSFLSKLKALEISSQPIVQNALLSLKSSSKFEKQSRFMFGVAIPDPDGLDFAIQRTINANLVEAALVFDSKLSKSGVSVSDIDALCIKVLQSLLDSNTNKSDWAWVYARGESDLRASILLKLSESIKTPLKQAEPREKVILSSILTFIRTCLPTDKDIFSHIFKTLQYYPGAFSRSTPAALQILTAEFSLDKTNPSPDTRTISFSPTNLPAKPDWMYLPLTTYNLSDNHPDDAVRVVSTTLQFIQTLETQSREPPQYDALKIANLMKLYLLPPCSTGQEIYTLGDITPCVSGLLDTYRETLESGVLDLESVFGNSSDHNSSVGGGSSGNTQFYKLYQELVAQWLATSFGDVTFTRLVVLPLQMRYPYDFRALFWSEVNADGGGGLKLLMNMKEQVIAGRDGLKAYCEPVETSEIVVNMYLEALVKGLVVVRPDKELKECVFRAIAVAHVAGYLFRDGGGGGGGERVGGFRRSLIETVKKLDQVCLGSFLDEFFAAGVAVSLEEVERRRMMWESFV
ncbi:hypothetical protein BDR26DRAFT_918655, partial [Obelidium mucronatum]